MGRKCVQTAPSPPRKREQTPEPNRKKEQTPPRKREQTNEPLHLKGGAVA